MPQKVACPRCGTFNTNTPVWWTGEVHQESRGSIEKADASYPVGVKLKDTDKEYLYALNTCGVCEKPFFVHEGKAVWPAPTPIAPNGLPDLVEQAFLDAERAFAGRSKIGALAAAGAALERMLGDKRAKSFKALYEELRLITSQLYGAADQIRLWNAMVKHDDVDLSEINQDEIRELLDFLRSVLEAVYTHQEAVNRLIGRREELRRIPGSEDTDAADIRTG